METDDFGCTTTVSTIERTRTPTVAVDGESRTDDLGSPEAGGERDEIGLVRGRHEDDVCAVVAMLVELGDYFVAQPRRRHVLGELPTGGVDVDDRPIREHGDRSQRLEAVAVATCERRDQLGSSPPEAGE